MPRRNGRAHRDPADLSLRQILFGVLGEPEHRARAREGLARALDKPEHVVLVLELLGRVTGEEACRPR
jgi:hypothetical protein